MQPVLDFKLLQTFVRAAQSGSLSAAAIEVGRTQSAVTMQIQRLEDILGQRLLHRSGAGVRLTGAGERFLPHAERILRVHDEAMSAFSAKGLRGSIIFGCPEDYLIAFFPALLKSFGTSYPDVEVRVVTAPTVELRTLLNSRQIDLALVSTADPGAATEIIRRAPLVWVGGKPTLELHNFSETVRLALPASNAMDHRAACDAMNDAGLRFMIAYASNSLTGLIAAARSGLAISVMTEVAVPPDLHILGKPLPTLPSLGILMALAASEGTSAVNAFADHIRRILPTL